MDRRRSSRGHPFHEQYLVFYLKEWNLKQGDNILFWARYFETSVVWFLWKINKSLGANTESTKVYFYCSNSFVEPEPEPEGTIPTSYHWISVSEAKLNFLPLRRWSFSFSTRRILRRIYERSRNGIENILLIRAIIHNYKSTRKRLKVWTLVNDYDLWIKYVYVFRFR